MKRSPKGKRLTAIETENMRGGVDFIFRNKYAKIYSLEKLNGPNSVVHSIYHDNIGYFQPAGVRRVALKVYASTMVEDKEFDRRKKV